MKLVTYTTTLVLTALFMLSSCKTKQVPEATTNLVEGEELYYLSKGPCFGRCPVFSMTIYDNGLAKYRGAKFTKLLGTYTKTITQEEMSALDKLFKESDFGSFSPNYESLLPDLPLVKIGYVVSDTMSIVMGKETRPESLVTLQYALDNIANQEGWELIEPLPVDDVPIDMVEDNLDKSQIIIKHKGGTQVPKWFNEAREAYGIRIVDQVADQPGAWLITYRVSEFSPEDIMTILENDATITSAKFLEVNK